MLLEPNYSRNIIPIQEQKRREAGAGYIDGKRPATGPPRPELLAATLTPLTVAAMNALGGIPPPPYQP